MDSLATVLACMKREFNAPSQRIEMDIQEPPAIIMMEEKPVEIEMWSTSKGEWEHHSTYLNREHAQQNLASLQRVLPSMRYRIKPETKY